VGDPEYREILAGLKVQLIRLLRNGVELGLLEKEETVP
jgi:hypothetical protein